ncbi:hypothetical protein [Bradyrhizobium sp. 2TAF24]|uniref:hypothetical protein n=1 Tax=Bradyrhizobium sp. 2TAF24 TaxID=3233011 RepID=UPI003F8E91EF
MPATGFIDAVGFNPTAGGTGSFVVSAALTGYQTPAAGGAVNGAVYAYRAQSLDLTQWEIGFGTYASGTTTLARTTITANSAGTTAAINFSTAPNVYCTALSADLINLASTGSGYVNKFRNAGMDIWQRGTSISAASGGGTYTADGWMVTPSGAAVTVTQAAGRLLGTNSLKVTGAASVTDVLVYQRIESLVAAPLASQSVTVQAQIYNNTGASITPTLTVTHPSAIDNWSSAQTTDLNAASLQPCPNGAWTRVAYTFSAAAASGYGLQVLLDFGNNLSSGGKSVQVTELDIRVTPFAPVGLNAAPPPPELRAVGTEMTFCQRYFQKSYGQGVPPGSNVGGGGGAILMVGPASGYWGTFVRYPVVMRASIQPVTYDNAGASGKVSYLVSAWTNGGTPTISAWSDSGFAFYYGPQSGMTNLSMDYAVSAEL